MGEVRGEVEGEARVGVSSGGVQDLTAGAVVHRRVRRRVRHAVISTEVVVPVAHPQPVGQSTGWIIEL